MIAEEDPPDHQRETEVIQEMAISQVEEGMTEETIEDPEEEILMTQEAQDTTGQDPTIVTDETDQLTLVTGDQEMTHIPDTTNSRSLPKGAHIDLPSTLSTEVAKIEILSISSTKGQTATPLTEQIP